VRKSRAASWVGAVTLVVAAGVPASAHRRDEFLQAARLSIDPGRVEIELDLTPGIAVVARVLAEIDLDRNESISNEERLAYSARLLKAISIDVDGRPLALELVDSVFADLDAMRKGEGTVRIQAAASLPALAGGVHQLRYRNNHRRDISAYLANALAPSSARIAIAAQRRDHDQRELTVEYTLRADRATRVGGGLSAGVAGALLWLVVVRWRRSRTSG
jgi:hypothetical protein